MQRKFLLYIALVFVLSLFAGCTKPQQSIPGTDGTQHTEQSDALSDIQLSDCKLPSQKDFLLLLCENCDIVRCNAYSSANFQQFQLISSKPLAKEEMRVTLENIQCDFSLTEVPMEFPYYVFQAYQGQSWGELYQLSLSQDTAEGEKKFLHERERFENVFQQIAETDIPKLYTYDFIISLSNRQVNAPAKFHTLTLTAGGQTQTYEIGNFQIVEDFSLPEDDGNLLCQTLASIDMPIAPSPNGEISICELQFDVQEDLEIVDVAFLGEDAPTIKELTLSSAETGVDAKWDAREPFAASKGDTITLRGSACAPMLAGQTSGSLRRYLKVEYVCGGKTACTVIELGYRMRLNSYEAYASMVDGVDMQSYYTDYYFKTLAG